VSSALVGCPVWKIHMIDLTFDSAEWLRGSITVLRQWRIEVAMNPHIRFGEPLQRLAGTQRSPL